MEAASAPRVLQAIKPGGGPERDRLMRRVKGQDHAHIQAGSGFAPLGLGPSFHHRGCGGPAVHSGARGTVAHLPGGVNRAERCHRGSSGQAGIACPSYAPADDERGF